MMMMMITCDELFRCPQASVTGMRKDKRRASTFKGFCEAVGGSIHSLVQSGPPKTHVPLTTA